MARKFFYICAGMFLLALAYQLGVTNARGQAGGVVVAVTDPGQGSYVVDASGAVYFTLYGSNLAPAPHWSLRGTISSSSPIVHIEGAGTTSTGQDVEHAFASNGDFFVSSDGGRTWSRHGNVFGAATPALHQSWGQLKSRYAPNTEQTPPASPQDR
jgi:hypothetical protein